jgi:hypothetical protein
MSKTSPTAEAYEIICNMEQPLEAVANFARLIARFAETIEDENDGAACDAIAPSPTLHACQAPLMSEVGIPFP